MFKIMCCFLLSFIVLVVYRIENLSKSAKLNFETQKLNKQALTTYDILKKKFR